MQGEIAHAAGIDDTSGVRRSIRKTFTSNYTSNFENADAHLRESQSIKGVSGIDPC